MGPNLGMVEATIALHYVFEGLEPTETSKMLNNEYQSVYTLAAYVQDLSLIHILIRLMRKMV